MYTKFNTALPPNFTGHSLSVSDIVGVKIGDAEKFHYVDSFGFKEIQNFQESQLLMSNNYDFYM